MQSIASNNNQLNVHSAGMHISTVTRKAKLRWMTSHHDQPLYKVSLKYPFTFSFDSALRKCGEFITGIILCDIRCIPA